MEDEYSESQNSTSSTEMSVMEKHDKHLVVLRLKGENGEKKEEGTHIKGHKFKLLKKFCKSQFKRASNCPGQNS